MIFPPPKLRNLYKLTSFCLFPQFFTASRVIFVPFAASKVKSYSGFSSTEKALWCNTATSLLHSTVSSCFVILVILFDQTTQGDIVTKSSNLEFLTLCVSTGYFAYDLWDYVVSQLYLKSYGVVVHHVVILICYISALFKNVGIPFLAITLICELNSLFMHLRKLLSMSKHSIRQSQLYRGVWYAQWITFVTARLLPHIVTTVWVWKTRHFFPRELFFYMAFIGMVFIDVLNAHVSWEICILLKGF